ncbi:MAG: hydrogenase maturation protease [Vulcanimicrobiaceae bacterium]
MSARILVAGVGNVFFGDDGFGSEVLGALVTERVADVKYEDFGIASLHLAFELLAGYERAIVVDAVPRGGLPGTLYLIEPDTILPGGPPDAHGMDLRNVFAFVRTLGGTSPPIEIVGCEPLDLDAGIGLSAPVAAAVEPAVRLVRERIARARSVPSHRERKPS